MLQIADVKVLVAAKFSCTTAALKLIFSGKILKDEDTLAASSVKTKADGGFIVVMISAPKVSINRTNLNGRCLSKETFESY